MANSQTLAHSLPRYKNERCILRFSEPVDEQRRFGQPVGLEERTVGFFLCPSFTLLPFTSALEPLRGANRHAGRTLYRWRLITEDGEPVVASNGIAVKPDASIAQGIAYSRVFVSGPFDPILIVHDRCWRGYEGWPIKMFTWGRWRRALFCLPAQVCSMGTAARRTGKMWPIWPRPIRNARPQPSYSSSTATDFLVPGERPHSTCHWSSSNSITAGKSPPARRKCSSIRRYVHPMRRSERAAVSEVG